MRTSRFTLLYLIIFIITESCLTVTDSDRKRNKNVYTAPSTTSAKKSRNVEGAVSTSGAAAGAGSSSGERNIWVTSLDKGIVASYYKNMKGTSVDWKKAYAMLSEKHPNPPHSNLTHDRANKLILKLLHSTPAWGEGETLWNSTMKSEILRIYYTTTGVDEKEHAQEMYNKWRKENLYFPDISPMHLLQQAENMLMKNKLLISSEPLQRERMLRIHADRDFKFKPEHEDILLKILMRTSPNQQRAIETFYDEICKEDPSFCHTSPQKVYTRARNLMKERETQKQKLPAPGRADGGIIFSNQSRQGKHHSFYEFMSPRNNSLVHSKSVDNHTQEIGGSSLYQGFIHEHPDLGLGLSSNTVGTSRIHHPDVDLELSLSSEKKKDKTIQRQ